MNSIVSDELKAYSTLDEVQKIKDKYEQQGYKIRDNVYTKKMNSIVSDELKAYSTLDEVQKIKDKYEQQGYKIRDNVYTSKMNNIASNELKQCQTLEDVEIKKAFYIAQGYKIDDYLFKDRIIFLIEVELYKCKTINELVCTKNKYTSQINDFPNDYYTKMYNSIITSHIKKCNDINSLINFKKECTEKGIDIPSNIYIKQQNAIVKSQLDNISKIEILIKLKDDYAAIGVDIVNNVYNDKLYNLILKEIKNCTTNDELNNLRNNYKRLGLNISDETFDYYINKLNNPTLTETEIKIKTGNKHSNERFQEYHFNPDDPKYKTDIPGVCKGIQSRLEREMGVLDENSISKIVHELSLKKQIPEDEVLEIMSRLTQFGNYKKLTDLATELNKYDISGFYTDTGISTNSSLNYLHTKEQFKLNGKSGNQAFILDEAGIKYLESLDSVQRKDFYKKIQSGKIVLIELDGTNLKIGDNYYSYTMLDGGQNLSAMTEAIIEQMQEGKSLDEVFQSDIRERLNNVFNKTAQTKDFATKHIKTISVKEDATVGNITKQIRPNMPDADYIQKVISTIIDETENLTESESIIASSVIAKYIDYMVKIYSQDSFSSILKTKYSAIEQLVLQTGKTMDDVVYIYPSKDKSFDLVNLQYAKINDIDPSKIIHNSNYKYNPELDGKVIVILDDVVGSGQSMLSQEFDYKEFLNKQKDTNIIFAPITCAEFGKNNIENTIQCNSRVGLDFIHYNDYQCNSFEDFLNMLEPNEIRILDMVIGYKGFNSGGIVTGFQYMTPDNNSSLGGYLNIINLNNPDCDSANKPFSNSAYNKTIHEILCNYINNRQ